MQTYAYTSNTNTRTVMSGPDGFDPAACYKGPPLPDGAWVAAPDDILPGDAYVDGQFIKAPRPSVQLAPLDFMRRFTQQERIAIRNLNDPIIEDFMALLNTTPSVHLDDPDTVAAIGYLEQLGILSAGRAAEILA